MAVAVRRDRLSLDVLHDDIRQAVVRRPAVVETGNVDLVEKTSGEITKLIAAGIPLSGDKWAAGPRYFFTEFQDIKTDMLAEATVNARESAEEFAKNSGSVVGGIKFANQGVFQIMPASRNNDQEEFYADKLVRVVTTIQYTLK